MGFGEYSAAVTVLADKVPQFMNMPLATSITPSAITLQWTDLTLATHTGGDPVIFYELEWESSPGVWTPLTTQAQDGKVLQKVH